MTRPPASLLAVALVTAMSAACGSTGRASPVRHSHADADVAFMRDMIHHHAQALVMAQLVPDRAASDALRTLAARIINSQKDEIALMQRWLEESGEPAPEVSPTGEIEHDGPMHHGPATRMPGMLTDEQMAELDAARGFEFDLLFLRYMIQHHEGALTMVEDLFATYGAAQQDAIFRLASDIGADQTAEIERMRTMLREMMFETADSP